MKPVTLKGMLDIEKQVFIEKQKDNERGVEVIAPFYTHLNKNDEPCGVLVNRGWMPWDLKNTRYDTEVGVTQISGVLYKGDAKTKDSKKNVPVMHDLWFTYPEELATLMKMSNEDEASKFMVKMVDFDELNRTAMPDVQSPSELSTFVIPAERHEAYLKLWNCALYLGVVANTWVWLYL